MRELIDFKDLVGSFESLATAAAIIIGGFWTYVTFIRTRQKFPRAKIEHSLTCRTVNLAKVLVSVDIIVSNGGGVLLQLLTWKISLKQMLPPAGELRDYLDPHEDFAGRGIEIIDWKMIAAIRGEAQKHEMEIEPGDHHQFHHDFLADARCSTVMVESRFENAAKKGRPIGWGHTTTHDLSKKERDDDYQGTEQRSTS
jgi:hypothetical protein